MKNKNKSSKGEFASLFRKGFKGTEENKEKMEFNEDQQKELKKDKKKKSTFSKIMDMLSD